MAANSTFSFTYKLTSGFLHYCTSHVFSLLSAVPFIPIQHIRILVNNLRFHNLPDALYKLLQSDREEKRKQANLGIEVELQNRLFAYFTKTLSVVVQQAKRSGRWDEGILGKTKTMNTGGNDCIPNRSCTYLISEKL